MAVIVLCSATGAPGVTTAALGLTLAWRRDVLLVDCDRDAGQPVLAGYLQGADPDGCGLLEVARRHREGRSLGADLLSHALPLAEEPMRRRFVPGFTRPATARLFEPVWPSLAAAMSEVSEAGVDILVDAGRIGASGLPRPLVDQADEVLLVTRSSLRALAAARFHLDQLLDQMGAAPTPADVNLLLVGQGSPYSAAEIAAQFGQPVIGVLDLDPAAASVLSDGAPPGRRGRRSGLWRSLQTVADTLSSRSPAWQEAG